MGPDTEDTFDDEFWDSLDCVVNALDNIQASKSWGVSGVAFRLWGLGGFAGLGYP